MCIVYKCLECGWVGSDYYPTVNDKPCCPDCWDNPEYAELLFVNRIEEMTVLEMFDTIGELTPKTHLGFTIGRGKKKYWYLTPYPRRGLYRALPIERNELGWPRYITSDTKITVIFEEGK